MPPGAIFRRFFRHFGKEASKEAISSHSKDTGGSGIVRRHAEDEAAAEHDAEFLGLRDSRRS